MLPARRVRFRAACSGFLVVLAVALVALFVRPPRRVLASLLSWSSVLVMQEDQSAPARLIRGYLQIAVASHLASETIAAGGRDDEILMRMMLEVRRVVLNPRDAPDTRYEPFHWPALLAGVGYCDQLNGAVCSVAAHHFDRCEIVGLYDVEKQAMPHTIGRAWSRERHAWLYFDAFYAEPVIFTKDAAGRPHVVRSKAPAPTSPRARVPDGTYALPAWKLADFPKSFPMYAVSRLRPPQQPVLETQPGTTPSAVQAGGNLTAPPVVSVVSATRFEPVAARRDDRVYERLARAYVAARAAHLLGTSSPRDAYREVVADRDADSDDRAAEIAAIAARFAERPSL